MAVAEAGPARGQVQLQRLRRLVEGNARFLAGEALHAGAPTLPTYLIMIGFILNAAVPPLHAWLPDAYGEATFNGSVFLCAFTTKTAVYALCRGQELDAEKFELDLLGFAADDLAASLAAANVVCHDSAPPSSKWGPTIRVNWLP